MDFLFKRLKRDIQGANFLSKMDVKIILTIEDYYEFEVVYPSEYPFRKPEVFLKSPLFSHKYIDPITKQITYSPLKDNWEIRYKVSDVENILLFLIANEFSKRKQVKEEKVKELLADGIISCLEEDRKEWLERGMVDSEAKKLKEKIINFINEKSLPVFLNLFCESKIPVDEFLMDSQIYEQYRKDWECFNRESCLKYLPLLKTEKLSELIAVLSKTENIDLSFIK